MVPHHDLPKHSQGKSSELQTSLIYERRSEQMKYMDVYLFLGVGGHGGG